MKVALGEIKLIESLKGGIFGSIMQTHALRSDRKIIILHMRVQVAKPQGVVVSRALLRAKG